MKRCDPDPSQLFVALVLVMALVWGYMSCRKEPTNGNQDDGDDRGSEAL